MNVVKEEAAKSRCRCLVTWWFLLLLLASANVTAQSQDHAIVAWATATGGALHIEWTISAAWTSSNSADKIEGYRVFLNEQEKAAVSANTLHYELYGLKNNTAYTLQVQATLVNNDSILYSEILSTTTLDRTAPRPPDTPKQVAVTGGFIQVQVDPPADTGGADLIDVTVMVRLAENLRQVAHKTQLPQNAKPLVFDIYGLDARTTYRISAFAVNKGELVSLESAHLVLTTRGLQLPGPCPSPQILETTGASIVLRLIPPRDDGGGRILGYNVYMATDDTGNFQEVASTIGTNTIDVVEILYYAESNEKQLRPNTRYMFKAAAVNVVDICISVQSSLQLAAATEVLTSAAAVPVEPPSLYFLKATGGLITMTLMKPVNMRGSNCTGFLITIEDGSGNILVNIIETANDTTYDATSLRADSSYMISAAVVTPLGNSPNSTQVMMNTTGPTAPTEPRSLTLVNVTGSSATMKWSLPLDSGGADIAEYTIRLMSLGSQEERSVPSSPALLRDLVANTVYTVKMSATNASGKKSPWTVGVTFKTQSPTIPSEPWGISSISASGGSIEVMWNPPKDRGGQLLHSIGYKAAAFSASSCFDSAASVPCSSCNAVKVSGTQYQLVGNASVCDRPETQCPDSTLNCCLTRVASKYGFGVACGQLAAAREPQVVVGITSALFEGLNYSSLYYFGVQAMNLAGKSEMSNPQEIRTTVQTAPSYPANLRQLGATGGSIQLTWDAPLDTGGGPIIGYRVYRDYELLTPGYVMPPYTDCGEVVAETTYVYGVAAMNASLTEGAMAFVNLHTESLSSPLPPTLNLLDRMYNQLQVSVVPPCDTGGDTLLRYQYMVKTGADVIASGNFTCCDFVIGNLKPAESYVVSVSGMNSLSLSSPWVQATYKTTSGIPSIPVATILQANTYSAVVALGSPSDEHEIRSYDIHLHQDGVEIRKHTVLCQGSAASHRFLCPSSYKVEPLAYETEYAITVAAIGPLGSSVSKSLPFRTSSIAIGTFGMSKTDYDADKDGIISTVVHRNNGTSGSVLVGVNVTGPDMVLLRCESIAGDSCHCTLYLVSSAVTPKACYLSFVDGQKHANVAFSMWNDDSAELLPSQVVVAPFGVHLSDQHAALLHTDAGRQSGFVSFTSTSSRVNESSSFAIVDVVRLNGTTGKINFGFESFDMKAIAGEDYVSVKGTGELTDQQSSTQIWIQLIDNHVFNVDRAFGLRLADQNVLNDGHYLMLHTVTVRDDEKVSAAVPNKIGSISVVHRTGGEIEVEWTKAAVDDVVVSGYLVRVSPIGLKTFFTVYNTTQSQFTLSGLLARSVYNVQVAAWNHLGVGVYSRVFEVTTTTATPPSPPLLFLATNVTSTEFTLSWKAPQDHGGSPLNGYHLSVVKKVNGNLVLSRFVEKSTLQFVVEDLEASSAYACYVVGSTDAFPNSLGTTSVQQTSVTTAIGVAPSIAPAPTFVNQPRGGTLVFSMTRPKNTGGMPLTHCALYLRMINETYASTNGPFAIACEIDIFDDALPTCTIRNLLAATKYEVYAVFSNAMGQSLPGKPTSSQTNAVIDLPSPPLNLRASFITAGNIYLEWDLPADFGGSAGIAGYIIYQKYDYAKDEYFTLYDGQSMSSRNYMVKGLARHTTYSFGVVALNDASFCADHDVHHVSSFLQVSTLARSPLEPPGKPFAISATGGAITIGWSAPGDLAGVELQGYSVELMPSDFDAFVLLGHLPPDATSFTHYGLSDRSSYRYAVTAMNQDGPSARSEVLTTSTSVASRPTQVHNFRIANASGGSVLLSWDPPADTGGRRSEHYRLTRLGRASTYFSTSTSFEDRSKLSALTGYTYTIVAVNELYPGDPASLWAETGLPTTSDPPIFTSVIPFGGRLEVSWEAPECTGGIAINKYTISLVSMNQSVTIENVTTNALSYTFSNLVANTGYHLAGIAQNDKGDSISVKYHVQTGPPDVPGAPPKPTASNIQGGSVDIAVEYPAYRGGEEITMSLYKGGIKAHTFSMEQQSVTIYGLTAETDYTFAVSARNSVGETKSGSLKVTTSLISKPGQVENLQMRSVTFSQIALTWDVVLNTGGDEHVRYDVSYFKCSSDGVQEEATQVVRSDSTSALIVNLQYSSYYIVSVTAITSTSLLGSASSPLLIRTEHPFQGVVVAAMSKLIVKENAGVVSVPIDRVNGSFGNVSYTLETFDESAVDKVNYLQQTRTMTLASNVQSSFANVTIISDATYNPGIFFRVVITDTTTQLQTTTVVHLEDDDDAGYISFAEPALRIPEDGTASLTLTRTGGSVPRALVQIVVAENASVIDRFHLLNSTIVFEEGVKERTLLVQVADDDEFQYIPDSITIGFAVLEGGVLIGPYATILVTALDNADISYPKQCANVQTTFSSGGALGLEWTPPLDRGGVSITLTYLISLKVGTELITTQESPIEAIIIYGLTQSTTYRVSVQAVNSAGAGIESTPLLLATRSATMPTAPRNVRMVSVSSSRILLQWDLPLDDGGSPITAYTIYKVSEPTNLRVQFPETSCSAPNVCMINHLVALTSYKIQVQASSAFVTEGEFSEVITISTLNPEYPDTPPMPTVSWVSAGAMKIEMFDPVNVGGSNIHEYRLYLEANNETDFALVYSGASREHTVYRLRYQTTYNIKYQVVNAVGPSAFSPIRSNQTLAKSLPSAPTNVEVIDKTGGAIALTWNEPLDVGGRVITGYAIRIVAINGSSGNVVGYNGKDIPARQGTMFGLTAATEYSVQVVAYLEVSNCFDASLQTWSRVIQVATTNATSPRAAPQLLVGRFTGGIVELIWVPPKDQGGIPLTGYTLYLVNATDTMSVLYSTNNVSVLSFVHNDLTANTRYLYSIVAFNDAGDSPRSLPLAATTATLTFPSAPANVRQLTYNTGGAIAIGWERSVDTGGQSIAGYMVYRNGELVSETLSADARNYTDKQSLVASTSYNYTVRAIAENLMVSVASDECRARTTVATKPQKARALNAISGSSFLNVSWIPDGDTGGVSVTSYEVKLMLGSTLVESISRTLQFYLFAGLTASTNYTGYVKIYNTIGSRDAVSAILTTASMSVPDSPDKPLVVSVYGGNFTIQVEPPRFTGGSPITGLNIYEYVLGAATLKATLKVLPAAPLSSTFLGVNALSKYTVACSAVNLAGEGPQSELVTIETAPINQPGPVLMAPALVDATGTTLSFSWGPPADTGGSLDLSYDVRIANSTKDAVNPTVNLTYTATQLAYSSIYEFSVRAVNKNRSGPWSPMVTAKTHADTAGEFSFEQTNVSVLENATQIALVVQRTLGLSGRITLSYKTESTGLRPAVIGSDYAVIKGTSNTTGTLVFEPLQAQNAIIVFIINDADYTYPDKTFAVRITGVVSSIAEGTPTIGSHNVATVTIMDDGDAGFVSFEKPAYSFLEDARVGSVTIVREYGKSTSIALAFEFGGGTATSDVDYRKTATPIVMDNGITKATLTFSIINDKVFEFPDEYFWIQMTVLNGGAILRQPLTRITILDDGDVSDPGTCPPPALLSVTGGLATFAVNLPDHNGSVSGSLLYYAVRLSTATSSLDLRKEVTSVLTIGNLTASTVYSITIAAKSAFGLGTFSNATTFSTNAPSLPGHVVSVALETRSGGQISLTWSPPDDTGGISISKYRVYTVDQHGVSQIAAEILRSTTRAVVYGLEANTAYTFTIQAGNAVDEKDGWGEMSASFTYSTTSVTQPGPLLVSPDPYKPPTGGKVFVGWKPPLDSGGSTISSYAIYARSSLRPWYLSVKAPATLGPLFSPVTVLNASTTYEFFVLAENSLPSIDLPGKLSIAEGSRYVRTSVDLSSWVSVGSVISIQDTVLVIVDVSNSASGSFLLKYALSKASMVNQPGKLVGQTTSFSSLTTSEPTMPDLPPAPKLSIATGGMINITLLSPEDTGGIPVLDFAIYWDGQKLEEKSYVKTISKTNYVQIRAFVSVPKLKSHTSYNVSAVALNAVSLCSFRRAITGPNATLQTTNFTAPGAPRLMTYRTTGGGITMNLLDPHDTGGNDIQLYRLYIKRNDSVDPWQLCYLGPKQQASIAHLKPQTDYAFLMSISNGYFDSMNSSVKVVRTLSKSPPGSCEPATFVNATGGMLQVSWDYPADDGGSEVTDFYATITSALDGSSRTTLKTTTPSCIFYRLLADSSYDIVVRANNSYGLGPESAIATFQTKAMSPPAGTIDVNVQMTTGGAAEIAFGEPADLGGVLASDMVYNIYLDRENVVNMSYTSLEDVLQSIPRNKARRLTETGHRRLEAGATFSNILIGNMDPDTLYGIQIRPTTRATTGVLSSTFAIETTSGTVPSSPVELISNLLTGGSISLSWAASIDSGGIPLNGYSLYMSNKSKDGPFAEVYSDLLRTTTINQLKSSSMYWAYVTAWNDVGESLPSSVLAFSTRSVTAPSTPQNLTILAVGFDSIECAWNLPSDIGGDAIDSYLITAVQTNDPSISVTISTSETFGRLTTLSVSTSYDISVIAQNTFGDSSPASLTRHARTSAGVNMPSTPQIGCVSHNLVELMWHPYPGATSYHIVRDGTEIGTTTRSSFADSVTLATVASYAIRIATGSELSGTVSVTTLDPSDTTTYAHCYGNVGRIREVDYANNEKKRWRINPMSSFSYITLTFSLFELECDHDNVEILDALTEERLWKGGCGRTGRFVYQTKSSVVIVFSSDASVTAKGFELQYEIDGTSEDTRIPPPGVGVACSGHGRDQMDGSCKCSVGFTGEGCNNRIVCCADPQRCHHFVCDIDPAKVIVVAGDFGNDVQGTGQMMNTSEKGTASKAVRTISRALELSTKGSVILVYPGAYLGSLNRNLEVQATDLTITSLKGPYWTSVNCNRLSRFLFATSSTITMEGLKLHECQDANGGALKIVAGAFKGTNMLIADTNATENGGGIYASESNVSLYQVGIVECAAGAEGGAIYLEDSKTLMVESNVTRCSAARGGAIVLRGSSSLSTIDTEIMENDASVSGGGVFVDGNILLQGVHLSYNKAVHGGGLDMANGALKMEDCAIVNNTAEVAGGGVAIGGKSELLVKSTLVHGNEAGANGGGVYATGTISISFANDVVSPSLLTKNSALNGAGMFMNACQAFLQGMTAQDGYANVSGGGVAIVDSHVMWKDVVIRENKAQRGGGLMLSNSQLIDKGSVLFTENTAVNGGAIWMNASAMESVSHTLCLDNSATQTGGAIHIEGKSSVYNVTFETNSAPFGGCMHVDKAALTLRDAIVIKCTADVAGGGMWVKDSQITANAVSMSLNTASDGGGVFAHSSSLSDGVAIDTCSAVNHGGGMYLTGETSVVGIGIESCDAKKGGAAYAVDSELVVNHCTFSNSYASESGGGLYLATSTVQVTDTEILKDRSATSGGGVYMERSTIVHHNVSIAHCSSKAGAGIYLHTSKVVAQLDSSSSQISVNKAVNMGGNIFLSGLCSIEQLLVSFGNADSAGGIAVDSNSATIQRCSIVNNFAIVGGGLAVQRGSMCTLIDTIVSTNVATERGGGISATDAAVWHDNLSVLVNAAPLGGGMYVAGMTAMLKQHDTSPQALFQDNKAPTASMSSLGYGGGMYIAPSSQVQVNGLTLLDGNAERGAGVYVDGAAFALYDTLIHNGNASSGGGIYASSASNVELVNCSFVKNMALQSGSGGGIASSGGQGGSTTLAMTNCSLIGNSAGVGGGIMLSLTNVVGANTVLRENIARSGGAIAVLSEGSVLLRNWTFIDNTVDDGDLGGQGGSLYLANGVVTITDSQLVSNENATIALNGGLLYVENVQTVLTLINSRLAFGQAYSGGLLYSSNAAVRITNSSFYHGFAYNFGGGIYAVDTLLSISTSHFYENYAFYDGGGIFMKDGGHLIVNETVFERNAVEDRGGAIFLSPGAAVACAMTFSNFTRNTNTGLGSAIFVGRKNTAQLTSCILSENGDTGTDAGALNVIDAVVSVKDSLFELNTATKGAAIQISRSANVKVWQTVFRNNSALIQGGAIHASVRAVASFTDSMIEGNDAVEGGAVYAVGSALVTLSNSTFGDNSARSFGGAISMRGSALLTATGSLFTKNEAYTGGAISIHGNASLAVNHSRFEANSAVDFGAGIYVNKDMVTETRLGGCKNLQFGGNVAVAGDDIYWVYYPRLSFDCINCTSLTESDAISISTSAANITSGWWPASVTSGVSLQLEVPISANSSSNDTFPSRRLTISSSSSSLDADNTPVYYNTSLAKPGSSTLWPTLVVRDYYGAIATHDNMTRCQALLSTNEGPFSFSPVHWIDVDEGYIVFKNAEVLSRSRKDPYALTLNCIFSPVLQTLVTILVTVDKCTPGYENVNGLCLPCEKGTYSLDGEKCYLCPAGATCEQNEKSGTATGVVSPRRQEGFFVSKTRASYAEFNCDNPESWSSHDPCKSIDESNITALIHKCAERSETFYKHWSRGRIYSCLSGNEYYTCDTIAACAEAPAVTANTVSAQLSGQCAVGYSGVMCATCADGYYKASGGSCQLCSDPNDLKVARMTKTLAMLPLVAAVAALALLYRLFSNAAEQRVISQAQAAKRFQIYSYQSRTRVLLQAAKANIDRRVRSMMQTVAERARFGKKSSSYLFQIEPIPVKIPSWRPEKFKIILGFFQIIGSFKEVYEIPWPDTMSRLMDICSLADFNFVDTIASECLLRRDYFMNYRLALFALLGMLLLVVLVTAWGIVRYRVMLSTLPRHCVKCGLPVFTRQHHVRQALERQKALIAKLKTEQTVQNARLNAGKVPLIERLKVTLGMTTQIPAGNRKIMQIAARCVNWVDRHTQLPASLSTHSPSCPTSQRITNDVLNMVVHSNLRMWRARVWMRLYYKTYQNRCIKLFFWVLLLFYPMLCQRVIGTFYCDEVGDHFYMSLDRSNRCYEGTWLYYLPLSIVLVVLWVIGVPLLFWLIVSLKRSRGVNDTLLLIQDPSGEPLKQSLLLKMRLDIIDRGHVVDEEKLELFETEMLAQYLRDRNLDEPNAIAQVGFIYHSYSTAFWWFEVWDLVRKLLLNCIVSLLAKAGANRIICGLVVLLVYLSTMLFYQPYREPSDSALAGVTYIQLFITLFCGLILKMGSLNLDERVVRLVTNAAIMTNIMTLCYAAFSILNEKRHVMKKAQRHSREIQRRAVAAHVRRLWHKALGYALTEVYLENPDAGPMSLLVMTELARRDKYQQDMDELNAQVEFTSTMTSPPSAEVEQDVILSASQIDVMADEAARHIRDERSHGGDHDTSSRFAGPGRKIAQ